MINNGDEKYHIIVIPVTHIKELLRYQQSILYALGKIEIEKDNPEQHQHIHSLYTLMTHLRNNLSSIQT